MIFFNKEFYKNYLVYLIPSVSSFLFFWKLGDASFWYDELVTLNTVSESSLYQFFPKYFANHLNPPLHLILLKLYLYAVRFLNDLSTLLLIAVYPNTKSLNNLLLFFEMPITKFYEFFDIYFPESIVRQLRFVSETSLRLPSAVFLTVANIVIFDFFKKNKLILLGTVVSLLIGTNSKLIYYAQEARPYSLFIFIFVLVLYEFFKSYSKDLNFYNFKRLIFYNILLMATHYYGVIVICSEMLVLLIKNKKNKKFVRINLIASVTIMFLFVEIYSLLNVSKIKIFSEIGLSDIKNMHLNALGYFIDWKFLASGVLALTVKKLFKKASNIDVIYLKASLFLICILVMVLFFNMLRPIFNIRYVIFLIPLQILIIACIYYSISETIFLFVKNRVLKKIAVAMVFLIFASRLIIGQGLFHFEVFNYYENQKYYPIKSAYSSITKDNDYKRGAYYALEEYIGGNFRYYENKFSLKQLVNLDPKVSNSEKQNKLSEFANKIEGNIFYYIRVRHIETSQQEESVSIPQFSKKLIFKEQDIEAYKFTKEL